MELKEAVTAFLKARNALSRTLVDVVDKGERLIFEHKDHAHHVIIADELRVVDVTEKTTVACLNSRRNLDFLVEHWEDFLVTGLSVLFVNPDTQEQWKVMPAVHNAIAEPSKLKQGLESLFSQVTEY